ncbi:MAG TPA: hypothetical protein VLK37_08190 [Solirubrobacterales bacterium]|nr:hypothetical protein [Solirubrobacterales bacterium]
MGPGRARAAAIACLTGAVLLLAAGCGESRHANEPRPSGSTRVSVTINPEEVIVQPTAIGIEAEKFQQIPQNQNHPQPGIKTKAPLDVVFVTANQTPTDTKLKIRGTKDAESDTVFARGPGTFQVSLPAGSYTVSVTGMPGARPAHLKVGSFRASSQNDVLLP